jgi:predicted MFS family arabinose efflux permease
MRAEKLLRWFFEGATMFIVALASLFLLLYIGYGDGKRTYELTHIEKLTSQGRYLQNTIEKFVRDGLPLKQYAGFTKLASPILEGEDVDALLVFDHKGTQVFGAIDKKKPTLPPPPDVHDVSDSIKVDYGVTHYQITLPLRSRFETVGSVVVVAPNNQVTKRLYASFLPLVFVGVALSIAFAVLIVAAKSSFARSKKPWLQISYGMTFLGMAMLVVGTLIGLYFDGVEGKAKAASFTLSQRLSDIVEFRLGFKDLDGIDRAFREFRTLNSDISEAAVLVDNSVEITTDARRQGKKWISDSSNFEYRIDLSDANKPPYISLLTTVPKSVVFERVARSVKNFAALFIASAFLSGLFLQVASSLQRPRDVDITSPEGKAAASDAGLVIIKPAYFLAVFLDSLTYSFLPKFMQEAAAASGVSVGFASAPFTAYYLGFAASLIPAGVLCDRRGAKQVILLGLMLAAGSVLALALPLGIWEMTALRAISGVGQGVLLIGVQAYILAVASPEKKTQGAAIIVFGFQAALISGMALGSLMVNFLGTRGVFIIAGGVGLASLIYSQFLVPGTERKAATTSVGAAVKKLVGDLKKVVTELEFLKTLFTIGAPAKAILTGVITFALPLILGQAGYRPEDIGQVVMLYGLGVLLSSGYASRFVDRTKNSETVLFVGAIMSGVGMVMVGFMGSPIVGNGLLSTSIIVVAVLIVGLAHGFINAPVVSHIGQSALAQRVGANPTTTAYRFLERGGHITGPLLISQLFLFWGQGPYVIGSIGIAVVIFGLLFVAHRLLPRPVRLQGEPAE